MPDPNLRASACNSTTGAINRQRALIPEGAGPPFVADMCKPVISHARKRLHYHPI